PDYQFGPTTVPAGCASSYPLSPDEDAIEFILFDLSSCLTPVGYTPVPPGTPRCPAHGGNGAMCRVVVRARAPSPASRAQRRARAGRRRGVAARALALRFLFRPGRAREWQAT